MQCKKSLHCSRSLELIPHLLEGLHSAAINEVIVRLLNSPVDFAVELSWLGDTEIVLLAVKIIKQWVQASSDVPTALQGTLLQDAGCKKKQKTSNCQADCKLVRLGGVGCCGAEWGGTGREDQHLFWDMIGEQNKHLARASSDVPALVQHTLP